MIAALGQLISYWKWTSTFSWATWVNREREKEKRLTLSTEWESACRSCHKILSSLSQTSQEVYHHATFISIILFIFSCRSQQFISRSNSAVVHLQVYDMQLTGQLFIFRMRRSVCFHFERNSQELSDDSAAQFKAWWGCGYAVVKWTSNWYRTENCLRGQRSVLQGNRYLMWIFRLSKGVGAEPQRPVSLRCSDLWQPAAALSSGVHRKWIKCYWGQHTHTHTQLKKNTTAWNHDISERTADVTRTAPGREHAGKHLLAVLSGAEDKLIVSRDKQVLQTNKNSQLSSAGLT